MADDATLLGWFLWFLEWAIGFQDMLSFSAFGTGDKGKVHISYEM